MSDSRFSASCGKAREPEIPAPLELWEISRPALVSGYQPMPFFSLILHVPSS